MTSEKKNNWAVFREKEVQKQLIIYLVFAFLMIALNYLIQKTNQVVIAPYICENFGQSDIVQSLYCSLDPINMAELMGSIVAVGVTYLIKFPLDKYVVFKKGGSSLKDSSQEFLKYLGFAVLTTILNIGIQFIMTNLFGTSLEVSFIVALTIGYVTKFFLDRKYVFTRDYKAVELDSEKKV